MSSQIRKLWPDSFVEEANLTQNIYVLRKALDTGDGAESYIETIPRRGYRFAAQVKELPENEELVIPPTASGARISRPWVLICSVLLVGFLARWAAPG